MGHYIQRRNWIFSQTLKEKRLDLAIMEYVLLVIASVVKVMAITHAEVV